jgi:hypothetical protein
MMRDHRHRDDKVVAFRKRPVKRTPAELERLHEEEAVRVRTNIAGLLFAALLVVVGWLLVQKLGEASKLQDCFMSGRTNCAPIATTR